MCRGCLDKVRDLQDVVLPCRIKGCTRTWTFTAFAQLETLLNHDPADPPAPRMCPECFRFLGSAQDRTLPCRHRGCPNTWTYTKQMQLYDLAAGRKQPAPRLCRTCSERIRAATPRQEPCATPGCSNTWTYSPADQVRDLCAGKVAAPAHRCPECEAFLAKTQSTQLDCPGCGQPFAWSAYEQLLCKLGTFTRPERCSGCAEQQLALQRPAEPPIERLHHQVVRIPAAGRWHSDADAAQRPPHVLPETIAAVEAADVRIVAFGDDLTWSAADAAAAWPALLEARLNERLAGTARVAVVNAGLPHTTSRGGVLRIPRDVTPFGPQLVIFSFAFGDALLERRTHDRGWQPLLAPEEAFPAFEELCRRLQTLKCPLLYWTANPVLPLDLAEQAPQERGLVEWANAQEAHFDQILAHARHVCSARRIPVLDLRSRFEVNGKKSARKWMSDWYSHNASGAQNIAAWMADHLLHAKLLPLPAPVERSGP
jgi:lysophospholipase L1-like esterase